MAKIPLDKMWEDYSEDFLYFLNGKYYWNDKELTESEGKDLRSQAEIIMSFGLYEKLIKLLKTVGYQNIAKANSWEATQFGKSSLYMAFKVEEILLGIINPETIKKDGKV